MLAQPGDGSADEGAEGQVGDLRGDHAEPFAALGGNERGQSPENNGRCHAAEGRGIGSVRPLVRSQAERGADQQREQAERQGICQRLDHKDTSKSSLFKGQRTGASYSLCSP